MPLTIELYKNKEAGRLIIDRNNLIIQFLPNSNVIDDPSNLIAYKKRNSFSDGPILNSPLLVFRDISDPRHIITEHMCEVDKGSYHMHCIFPHAINIGMIMQFINDDKRALWLQYISEECYESLMPIIKSYFTELATDKSADEIEKSYRKDKEYEFITMSRQLQLDERKKTRSTVATSRFLLMPPKVEEEKKVHANTAPYFR